MRIYKLKVRINFLSNWNIFYDVLTHYHFIFINSSSTQHLSNIFSHHFLNYCTKSYQLIKYYRIYCVYFLTSSYWPNHSFLSSSPWKFSINLCNFTLITLTFFLYHCHLHHHYLYMLYCVVCICFLCDKNFENGKCMKKEEIFRISYVWN